jgi:hypothetical protein
MVVLVKEEKKIFENHICTTDTIITAVVVVV